jgi:hypothetical protein
MSKIEVNTVAPQCGTTLTLGESGDTVQLGTGASQSGFGRTGTVDWQTSIKTATFTAASGEGYFCDTASVGAFTVNLPSSPSVGDIVAIKDYASNFATANLTIGRGGSNLNGAAVDSIRNTDNESLTMVYADATKGWLAVEEGTGFLGESFMVATGGTETTSGNCKIHRFTGPGTFTVSQIADSAANNIVSYVVVGGGGGGGRSNGGGGGGGGFREVVSPSSPYTGSPLNGYPTPANRVTVTATSFPVTVGAGGAKATTSSPSNPGTDGSNSVFSTIIGTGGGGGGHYSNPGPGQANGRAGGSGGGAADGSTTGGSGNSPSVTPAQGTNGGNGVSPGLAGGGGGATQAGESGTNPSNAGDGGIGATSSITASAVVYSGGGGGGAPGPKTCGIGGIHPGGSAPAPQADRGGAGNAGSNGQAGLANTGGGSGGATGGSIACNVNTGGSGVVIIRYRFQ